VHPGHFERFLHAVHPLLEKYGYAAVFVVIFFENFGCPVPGETIFIAAILMAAKGDMGIVPVVLCAWAASVLGGIVGFAIGRFGGHRLLEKYGPYIGMNAERLKKTEDFFNTYGGSMIVLGRFFEGVRQIYAILAGCIAISWRKFLITNAVGATLWVGVWTVLVLWFGKHVRRIWAHFKGHEAYVFLAVAVVAALAAFILHRWKLAHERTTPGQAQ